jgi:putative transposase
MTDESRYQRLNEYIRRLPPKQLALLEKFVAQLSATRSSPLPTNPLPERDWPHAPLHRLGEHGTYLVTVATLHKAHHFRTAERLDLLEGKLLELAKQYGWRLEAWAVFSNHYHFVGHSDTGSGSLNTFLGHVHTATAATINEMDDAPGREVWHNFWETRLTFQQSYLARLNYVHQNAVKHRLVTVARHYRWCSAGWFERTATPAQVKTIYRFKTDKVRVLDAFEVLAPVEEW